MRVCSGKVLFVDREGAHSIWSLMLPIAQALESDGWKTGFVAMQEKGREGLPEDAEALSLGVERIPVPHKRWPGDLLRQWRAFDRGFGAVLRHVRPDAVHVNFAVPGVWARIRARRSGVSRIVSTQHELRGSLAPHLRFGLWATDGAVDVHTYVSETVASSFGRSRVVIRNGIDLDALGRVKRSTDAIVRGRIVAPGRLVPEKGQALLIRALARVRETMPHAHMILAGSGPEEQRLRKLARHLGQDKAVTFAGWLPRDDLYRLYATAQAAAFASDGAQEGFGLALAEAAMLGIPLVVSRISAFGEVLQEDQEAAYWFEPGDTDTAVIAIGAAMRDFDSPGQQRMIERAGRNASDTASFDKMVTGYRDVYRRLGDAFE